MDGPNNYNKVLNGFSSNELLLTPNRRLANFLHKLYNDLQIQGGKSSWESANILPISTWVDTQYKSICLAHFENRPFPLSAIQENMIWEKVLAQSNYKQSLLRPTETAKLVKSAKDLLSQWRVNLDDELFHSTDDYSALKTWIESLQSICKKNNWLTSDSIIEELTKSLYQRHNDLPGKIYLAGFNELSPQLEMLFEVISKNGVTVESISPGLQCDSVSRTATLDQDDEIYQMAVWAKSEFESNPQKSIGCVLQSLESKRDRVEQIFLDVFKDNTQYNISAGKQLSKYPIIDAAMKLLKLSKKGALSETISFVLATPFIAGSEKEFIQRAVVDSYIRNKNISHVTLENIVSKQIPALKATPIFTDRFKKYHEHINNKQDKDSFANWSIYFNTLLSSLGWPGERVISSNEYQIVEQWLQLLTQMQTLDQVQGPVTFNQALDALGQLASSTPFQPKTPQTNIQILGVLEASGLIFDSLWVSGMDDQTWPAQCKPNPFIPKQLQRELKMPHASADRELDYCKNMTSLFQESAKAVIFSYAIKNNESKLHVSPLIRSITEKPISTIIQANYKPTYQIIFASSEKEIVTDSSTPIKNETEIVGGVEVLKTQALCPFKAYAECRLGARELAAPTPGIKASERGTIIHNIMNAFWSEYQTRQNLVSDNVDNISSRLSKIIEDELLVRFKYKELSTSYLRLEKQRLLSLLLEWLDLEKTREEFRVVEHEKKHAISIGPITLNVQVDRIDELSDGSKLVLDYKTGINHQISNWFSNRPEEPQLPLYAQLYPDSVASIAYAQIAPGKNTFKGISQFSVDISGIKVIEGVKYTDVSTWPEQMDEWRKTLSALSHDFYNGVAKIDPKDTKTTCTWCSLKPLCRITEINGELHEHE